MPQRVVSRPERMLRVLVGVVFGGMVMRTSWGHAHLQT